MFDSNLKEPRHKSEIANKEAKILGLLRRTIVTNKQVDMLIRSDCACELKLLLPWLWHWSDGLDHHLAQKGQDHPSWDNHEYCPWRAINTETFFSSAMIDEMRMITDAAFKICFGLWLHDWAADHAFCHNTSCHPDTGTAVLTVLIRQSEQHP